MLYPCSFMVRLNDALDESKGLTLDEAVTAVASRALSSDDDM